MKEMKTQVYVTKTVRELVFDGYDDKMLDLVEKLNISINIPFKKFGWFVDVSIYIYFFVHLLNKICYHSFF